MEMEKKVTPIFSQKEEEENELKDEDIQNINLSFAMINSFQEVCKPLNDQLYEIFETICKNYAS